MSLAWESIPYAYFPVKSPKTTRPDLYKTEKSRKYSEKPCTRLVLVL